MSYNPGLLFYRHYYEGIQFGDKDSAEKSNERKFLARNKQLLDTNFQPKNIPDTGSLPGIQAFRLTTAYPGLVLGTGYAHGSGLLGEFKTGFYFDHTTGMPIIPGSSVKGLLRSAFPTLYYEKAQKARESKKQEDVEAAPFWEKLGDNRTKFIAALLRGLGYETNAEREYVQRLEREIFEGMHGTDREKHGDHFAMSERDIFFDAPIVASADGKVFLDEYITPHKKPLKNPVPIQLLKVRPGVTFSFQFKLLRDYHLGRAEESETLPRLLTPDQRMELFRQILMFLGAGAKTNSGFGHFLPERQLDLGAGGTAQQHTAGDTPQPGAQMPPNPASSRRYVSLKYDRNLSGSKELVGELLRKDGDNGWFRLLNVSGFEKELKISHALMSTLEVGAHYPLAAGRVAPAENILEAKIFGFKPLDS